MSLQNITFVTFSGAAYDAFWQLVNATYDYGEQIYKGEISSIFYLNTSTVLSSLSGAVFVIFVGGVWKTCKKLVRPKKSDVTVLKKNVLQLIKNATQPGCTVAIINEINALNLNVNEEVSSSGLTFFLFACLSGNTKLIKYMIHKGADVHAETKDGDNALYLATYGVVHCEPPDTACLSALIDAGCKVNQKNKRGYTPLHRAASRGNVKIIQFLMSEGADPSIANNAGVYPIDSAICAGHMEAASLLKLNVMNPHVWDLVEPHTPPHIKMGLQSPQRKVQLDSRPHASLRTLFTH